MPDLAREFPADDMYQVGRSIVRSRELPEEPRDHLEFAQLTPVAFAEGLGGSFAVMFVVNDEQGEVTCEVDVWAPDSQTGDWNSFGSCGASWPSGDLRSFSSAELQSDLIVLGICQVGPAGEDAEFMYGVAADTTTSIGLRLLDGRIVEHRPMRFGAWVVNTRAVDLTFHPVSLD